MSSCFLRFLWVMKIKPWRVIAFFFWWMMMTTHECSVCNSQVFKACCCYKWASLRFLLLPVGVDICADNLDALVHLNSHFCACVCVLETCCGEQQWAVVSVQVLHGCDASITRVSVVEVVQSLALLPVPKAKTNTLIRRQYDLFNILTECGSLWPDAVLVSHSDAGVEGVELDHWWHSGVAVDEYLIIQARNTWNRGENPKVGMKGWWIHPNRRFVSRCRLK